MINFDKYLLIFFHIILQVLCSGVQFVWVSADENQIVSNETQLSRIFQTNTIGRACDHSPDPISGPPFHSITQFEGQKRIPYEFFEQNKQNLQNDQNKD